jgi:NADH-quinone oxidoreductase subunit E
MEETVQHIFARHEPHSESLIAVLQDIQEHYHYLSEENLMNVADHLSVPVHQVYAVATFYNAFSLTPKGKHVVQVCMGTACHVRGAPRILEELERVIGISNGETTADAQFSLETVNCLGACALGPIMVVDGEYYGNMEPMNVSNVISKYAKESAKG